MLLSESFAGIEYGKPALTQQLDHLIVRLSLPDGALGEMRMLIWYRPGYPGVTPAYKISPSVAVGVPLQ